MKNFSLKALGALLFAAGLVVAGVAAPANAAALITPTVTATGAVTTGAVTYPITVSATTATSGVERFIIEIPSGWSTTMNGGPNCTGATVTGMTITGTGCAVSGRTITLYQNGAAIGANTLISVTFVANKFTATSSRDFAIGTADISGTTIDSGIATLASGSSSYTATFDANGGVGTTSTQTSSVAANLTSNGFTRSGFNFAGWNTAADGSGTAYADGASYPFTSSTTLYAQWTATLANTGVNTATGISLLAGGMSLALVGAEMFTIARRKRSN